MRDRIFSIFFVMNEPLILGSSTIMGGWLLAPMVDKRSHGSVCCRSKKERHATRPRATPLDLRAWRANAGVNATRSIKVESLYPGTLLITRGAHSPRPAVSLPLIAADVFPPSPLPPLPRAWASPVLITKLYTRYNATASCKLDSNINKFVRCSQMRAATFADVRRRRQRRRAASLSDAASGLNPLVMIFYHGIISEDNSVLSHECVVKYCLNKVSLDLEIKIEQCSQTSLHLHSFTLFFFIDDFLR